MAGSAKRVIGAILFLVALAATAFFVFLLFADANNIDSIPGTGEVPTVALVTAVLLGVIILLLILVLAIRKWDRQREDAEEAEPFFVPEEYRPETAPTGTGVPVGPLDRNNITVYNLAAVPVDTRAWAGPEAEGLHVFHYPRFTKRAVFINDYIDVGPGVRLKLRTLLAGPPGAFRGTFDTQPSRPAAKPEPRPNGRKAPEVEEVPAATAESVAEEPLAAQERPAPRARNDDFMTELERRYESRRTPSATRGGLFLESVEEKVDTPSEYYYDYKGDVHDVIDIEGIGPVYAEKLRSAGIHTTARLCYEPTRLVADAAGVPEKTAQGWKTQAELIKINGVGPQYAEVLVRAGITGIQELKNRSAKAIADQINEYLGTIETNVQGNAITAKRVESWQEAAKPMRRVRSKVPEN